MGGVVLYWGDGKFLKFLHIVGRGVLTPLFYEDPLILPTPPFPNFVHPHAHFNITSKPHPYSSFCYPISLAELVIMPYLKCYFT